MPTDLAVFEATLDVASLTRVVSSIQEGGIHLSIPKWTARTHLNLNKALSDLGMPTAFSGGADFSGMTGSPGLFLSTVRCVALYRPGARPVDCRLAADVLVGIHTG